MSVDIIGVKHKSLTKVENKRPARLSFLRCTPLQAASDILLIGIKIDIITLIIELQKNETNTVLTAKCPELAGHTIDKTKLIDNPINVLTNTPTVLCLSTFI